MTTIHFVDVFLRIERSDFFGDWGDCSSSIPTNCIVFKKMDKVIHIILLKEAGIKAHKVGAKPYFRVDCKR